jgi:hypothetical protein
LFGSETSKLIILNWTLPSIMSICDKQRIRYWIKSHHIKLHANNCAVFARNSAIRVS